MLYATESMRLTTRLLDLASWLLIRRALREGEITDEEAQKKRRRVKLQAFGRPSHVKGYEDLPDGLKGLIEESFALHDRISQLDRAMSRPQDADALSEPAAIPSLSRSVCWNAPSRPSSAEFRQQNSENSKGPVIEPGLCIFEYS